MALANLGFNVTGIRAVHKNDDRDDCVNLFNDPTSNVQILVTNLRICGTAINLQECCSDVIFVDCPSNAQTALQASDVFSGSGKKQCAGSTCSRWTIVSSEIPDNNVLEVAACDISGGCSSAENVYLTKQIKGSPADFGEKERFIGVTSISAVAQKACENEKLYVVKSSFGGN